MYNESKCTEHAFELLMLSLEHYAIVKSDTEVGNEAITVHGSICVSKNIIIGNDFKAYLEKNLMSDELKLSGELGRLKAEAIFKAKQNITEKFGG